MAAAYALAAAREGADVLFVAIDGRPGMGPLLGGRELDSSDRILRRIKGAGQVRGRTIPADQAFGDYLELKGVGGMLRRAASAANERSSSWTSAHTASSAFVTLSAEWRARYSRTACA